MMTPAEVGLEDVLEGDRGHGFFGSNLLKSSGRIARWAEPITYLHIYECENFTVSSLSDLCPIFFFIPFLIFLFPRPSFSVLFIFICLLLASQVEHVMIFSTTASSI